MTRGWALFNAISVFVLALLGACATQEVATATRLAYEAKSVAQCDDFQSAKNALHARLTELTDGQLDQLEAANKTGLIICTTSLADVTAELRAIEGTLP